MPEPAQNAHPSPAGPGRFQGKVALITGPNDRGIGGAIAERLADEGASLALAGLERPSRLLRRLERQGMRAVWIETDVTSRDAVEAAWSAAVELDGAVDLLINNAGVGSPGIFDELSESHWTRVMEVNLLGLMRMTHAGLSHLRSPGAVIVNVASVLGLAGCPAATVYSASKAGIVGMTRSLACELAPRGIRVTAVAPGVVQTPMVHKHAADLDQEMWEQIRACHPLGVGSPHDVAAAVAFLCSSDARWITGITLPLGWTPQFPLPSAVLG